MIVVGARVAGSPLATHLSRTGLSVCLLDRAHFPSDTLSTHVFQNIPALRRLGVLERILATGAPLLIEARISMDEVDLSGVYPDLPMLCVRRPTLDQILLDNAIQAGAQVNTRTRVVSFIEEKGTVKGIRAKDSNGKVYEFKAPVVIGADGRNSTVARLVGARRYNVTQSERAFAWTYYRVADRSPRICFYRQMDDLFMACPADAGTHLVVSVPTHDAFTATYKDGGGDAFERAIRTCSPLADLLDGAERMRKPVLVAGWQGYFRESAGPGWALLGDAGHFKDPTPGQGISDALRQAEHLADFIATGFHNSSTDDQLRAYWRWRDQDSTDKYWLAQRLGRARRLSLSMGEVLHELSKDPAARRAFYEMLHHLRPPSDVLRAAHLLKASTRVRLQR